MFLQGNLQAVFDALYSLGIIDPVLQSDWKKSVDEFYQYEDKVQRAVSNLNSCDGDQKSIEDALKNLDMKTLEYIAIEVAREYADFYSRKVTH